jgi:hypothetical protein
MKNKFSLLIFFLLINQLSWSQTNLKFNMATALIGVPNVGFETKIADKMTFQLDAQASFWKSVNGAPMQFFMIFPEVRYYPKQAAKGFFVGAHIGGGAFKLQKWNYKNTDLYQQGYNIMYGVTLGYQFNISSKFNLEIFAGGGNQQGYYKGYYISTGERYDLAKKYNKSGEIIPYRGGLMLVYKLDK